MSDYGKETRRLSLTMPVSDWELVDEIMEKTGLGLATLVRMILLEQIRKETN